MKGTRAWKLLFVAAIVVIAGAVLVCVAARAGLQRHRQSAAREEELSLRTGLQELPQHVDGAQMYPISKDGSVPWNARILLGEDIEQLMELLERNTTAEGDCSYMDSDRQSEEGFFVDFFCDGKQIAVAYLYEDYIHLAYWGSDAESWSASIGLSGEGAQAITAFYEAAPQLADLVSKTPEAVEANYMDYSGPIPLPAIDMQEAANAAQRALSAAQPYEDERKAIYREARTELTLQYADYTVTIIEYARKPMHLLRVEVSLFRESVWPTQPWLQLAPEDGVVEQLNLQIDNSD